MEYGDIMILVGLYLGSFSGLGAVVFGATALWNFYRSMARPDFRYDN